MPVEEQVVVLYAGTRGYLDSVPVPDVRASRPSCSTGCRPATATCSTASAPTGAIEDEDTLKDALQTFADDFAPTASTDEG